MINVYVYIYLWPRKGQRLLGIRIKGGVIVEWSSKTDKIKCVIILEVVKLSRN